MNRSTVPLTRALALALAMLTACRDVPDSPVAPSSPAAAARPSTTGRDVSATATGASAAASAGAAVGEVQFVGAGGAVGNTLALPAHGPAPDIDAIVAWARAQQASGPRPPLTPRSSILTPSAQTLGTALLDARDLSEVQRLLAPNAVGLTGHHETSVTATGRTRVANRFERGSGDIVRYWLETGGASSAIAASSLAPRVGAMGGGGGIVDDPCGGITPGSDPSAWPAQCVPGYDPAFQSSTVEPTIASMYASLATMNAGVSTGDPRDDTRCASVKATYYWSVGGFVWSAGSAIFWALQKNPAQMTTWIQRSWLALGAVNIAFMKVKECLSREF